MRDSLGKKLHYRELTDQAVRSKSYRSLYQDRRLINDLDIVNELDGHSGCVNALSWSKSGNLLASGSDDQHLNIHTYQPSTTCNQFQLALTVATGHTQNIFSVKFMPHSNDRTVITAAGDCEVRIFDLEYAGEARAASVESTLAAEGRRRGRGTLYHGVRYLNDGDTNCRVYRSHGDRVKRIVTESSPHLFLTCSEDGEVRQWDLRQPSSAYPRSTHHRFRYQDSNSPSDSNSAPPPLISYKRYNLDLNTISCSASQPHYIALGGAHLHAFLHDRRMTGRDRLREAGRSLSATNSLSAEEQELMSQATQCVRKFAPRGQRQMKNSDTGHITACKISDARPDEMIVSWSGDHIYSFDLIRDPSLDDVSSKKSTKSNRVKGSRDRKRKRHVNGSEASLPATGSASSRPRTADPPIPGSGALRIRYRNGQCEDIPFSTADADPIPLTEDQQEAQRIARLTIKIRQLLLSKRTQSESAANSNTFTEAFGHAASVIRDIDEKIRTWGYPLNPSPDQVYIQRSLRKTRESVRRFVQAAGTLCRVLGARLETAFGPSLLMLEFSSVKVRRSNDMWMTSREWFGYDFIKAILLWLDSGIGSLVEGFTRPDDIEPGSKVASHLPIPAAEAGAESVDEYLVPYLLRFASDEPVLNLETNRFEVEANRQLFPTEKAAVQAFAAAVKIPFQDLSSGANTSEDSTGVQEQDRQAAQKYWALKVARGILHNAAEAINFSDMDRAFGGIGQSEEQVLSAEDRSIDPAISEEEAETIRDVDVIDANGDVVDGATAEDVTAAAQALRHRAHAEENGSGGEDLIDSPSESAALLEEIEEGQSRHARVEVFDGEDDDSEVDNDYNEYDDDDDDDHDGEGDGDSDENDDHDEEDDDDDSSEPDEVDGVPNVNNRRFLYRSAFDRRRARPRVEPDTPASRPTRMYRGHCNVRTVKDVNYFGPDDEYVVSGSDDGNFFIWDRKTSELVNVLEGDGEVVNVIQGHPYETMMAVSGIDHTIKIFSPDARARRAARLGQGTSAHDAASFSTLAYPPRMGRRFRPTAGTTTSEPAVPADTSMDIDETDDYVAPNGLKSRQRMHDAYRIMQQNNIEREGGNHEAMITRRALAQLSQRIAHHRAETGRAPAPDGLIQLAVENDCMVQ